MPNGLTVTRKTRSSNFMNKNIKIQCYITIQNKFVNRTQKEREGSEM